MKIRFLAFYLPQYHPIPENDLWWGKGFTEWTNVAKAKPYFKDHYQPRFPADLGYYDLRIPDIREAQANMAKQFGVEGFIYYHYWFGNGRQLLQRPFNEVLSSGKPDFPFCLCWANETWRGAWFGEFTQKILMEQTYPGKKDYEQHFCHLLPAFHDKRYVKVNGKPVLNVYMPLNLPDIKGFAGLFNELAIREGFPGMFLIASRCPLQWDPNEYGFDAVIGSEMPELIKQRRHEKNKNGSVVKFLKRKQRPTILKYAEIIDLLVTDKSFPYDYYPCVIPNWDNTPRAENKGLILHNSTPKLFEKHLQKAINKVKHLPEERRFIFIKSWNEWAEGNYLEPDQRYGFAYLEELKKAIDRF